MPDSGAKSQLTITRAEIAADGSMTIDRTKSFTAMLNPSEFKHKREIRYNTRATLGQVGSDTRFSAVQPDTVTFSILLDGTGVVPVAPANRNKEVADHVKALNDVVYKYDGEDHEPDHVRLLWGTLILYGRLQSMAVQYTLFKPSGDPLRAWSFENAYPAHWSVDPFQAERGAVAIEKIELNYATSRRKL